MKKDADPSIAGMGIGAWMAKGLTAYIAFIGAQAFLVSVILRIPYTRMLLPVVLLSIPALFFGPLIYLSRKGGGVRLGMFMTGVVVSFVLFALALDYSAYHLGYLSPTLARDLIPFIFFTIIPIVVSLYFIVRLRQRVRKTIPK